MLLPADLYALGHDLRRAAVRRRRRRARRLAVVAVAAACAASAGVALGSSLLGTPAPQSVQSDLHLQARYALVHEPGLRLQTARVVGASSAATLYSIADRSGNYCSELIGTAQGVIYGFTCGRTRRAPNGELISDATAPGVSYLESDRGASPPIVQFGRLPAGTTSARAVYDNGTAEPITAGLDRFFVYQPSPQNQVLAREMPMTLEFHTRGGVTWSYYQQPPQPLRLHGDRRISGKVLIKGAAEIEIDVAAKLGESAARVIVPLNADRSFSYSWPPSSVVYRLTVRGPNHEPLSADTAVPTRLTLRQILSASKR
jgi:hypothetical protein